MPAPRDILAPAVLLIGVMCVVGWFWWPGPHREARSPGRAADEPVITGAQSTVAAKVWNRNEIGRAVAHRAAAAGDTRVAVEAEKLSSEVGTFLDSLVHGDLKTYTTRFKEAGQPLGAWAEQTGGQDRFRSVSEVMSRARWRSESVRVIPRDARRGVMPSGQAPIGTQSATVLANGLSPDSALPAWAGSEAVEVVLPVEITAANGEPYSAELSLVMSWNPSTRRWVLLTAAMRGVPPGIQAPVPPA